MVVAHPLIAGSHCRPAQPQCFVTFEFLYKRRSMTTRMRPELLLAVVVDETNATFPSMTTLATATSPPTFRLGANNDDMNNDKGEDEDTKKLTTRANMRMKPAMTIATTTKTIAMDRTTSPTDCFNVEDRGHVFKPHTLARRCTPRPYFP